MTPEEKRKKWRVYYQKNAEKLRARARQYYADHAEERRAYQREYGKNDPTYFARRYTVRTQRLLKAKNQVCMDCGRFYPSECVDFDHVRGTKKYQVGMMHGHSDKTFYEEVAKCDVVCSNCHRIRTWDWNENMAELRNNFMFRSVA